MCLTSETRLTTQPSFRLYFERYFRSLPAHAGLNAASVTAQLVHRERGAPCVGAEGRTQGPTLDRPTWTPADVIEDRRSLAGKGESVQGVTRSCCGDLVSIVESIESLF